MHHRILLGFALAALVTGCAAPTPSLESVPTYTPAPTYTPNPTLTPLPTYTPLPTLTPYPTITPRLTDTPTATRPPLPTARPVTATPVRFLDVEFNTINYQCARRCFADGGKNWDPGHFAYAYRTLHLNVRVVNLTKDRTLPVPWAPYFVVTDGATEWKRTDYWVWDVGPQPVVVPGATVNWTFIHFMPRPGLWVKEVGIEAWGQIYRHEMNLADARANAGYSECGEVITGTCPGNRVPPPPY